MTFRNRHAKASGAAAAAAGNGRVSVGAADDLSTYAELCRTARYAPPQSLAWIEAWVASTRSDGIIVTLMDGGRPVYALALDVEKSGPFRVARLMSGRHANGNFPPADPQFLDSGDFDFAAVAAAIRKARPDIDVIALERLLPEMDGLANPLAGLPQFPSPNIALAVDLDGGFDQLLSRVSGKRKRKKHRSQTRKFEMAGGFRRIEAKTPAEVATLLDAFFAMQTLRHPVC